MRQQRLRQEYHPPHVHVVHGREVGRGDLPERAHYVVACVVYYDVDFEGVAAALVAVTTTVDGGGSFALLLLPPPHQIRDECLPAVGSAEVCAAGMCVRVVRERADLRCEDLDFA